MTEAAPAPARVVQLVEAAQRYHRKGWVPLRLVGKDPQYMGKGWQKRQHDDPLPLYTASSNIGILTGEPSRDVVRLDADYEPIPEVTRLLHPEPTLLFGRASNPFSGRLVRSKVKSRDYRLPKALAGDARLPLHGNDPNLVVFQVLSTGKQTMMPPSIHPSGEEVVWQADDVLAEIDPEELYRRAGLEAFLMAVRHFWPAHGSRNEAAWSLARVLLEALEGSIADDGRRIRLVDELVVAVAVAGGGMGEQSRMGKVRAEATLARMRAGEAATGMTRLLELMELPEAVGKRFRQWLGDGPRDVGGVSWRERNQRGYPVASVHNAMLAMSALGIECRRDTFHNVFLVDTDEHPAVAGEVSDNTILQLRHLASSKFGFDLGEKCTRDAVLTLALGHCFDPVCMMLAEAEANWDGVPRLDGMAVDYFKCADTPLNRAFVRKTMIAAVRRARHAGCKFDNITVLEGPEGWNKSTAWRVLAGDENFSDQTILGVRDKEIQEVLGPVWIHESADLQGMKKAEVESVKAFASRQVDIARPAYGHFVYKQPRHAINVGTTNTDEYLQSQTGNRRFWPLAVLAPIDIGRLGADRLKLWGEAAKYERDGEALTIARELWEVAGEAQERRRARDPWEEVLKNLPDTVDDYHGAGRVIVHRDHVPGRGIREIVAASDLLTYVLHIPVGQQKIPDSMRLSTVMKKLGWVRPDNKLKLMAGSKQVRGYFRDVNQ